MAPRNPTYFHPVEQNTFLGSELFNRLYYTMKWCWVQGMQLPKQSRFNLEYKQGAFTHISEKNKSTLARHYNRDGPIHKEQIASLKKSEFFFCLSFFLSFLSA